MKRVFLRKAAKFNKNRKRRQSWQRVVQALIMVVVFCTTYALILPAVTMEEKPACGMEAHTHTEQCYEIHPVTGLVCTIPEDGAQLHQHSEACYDAEGLLICELPEITGHVHEDTCWGETGETEQTLTCALEEHVHEDSCYPVEEAPQGLEYRCGYAPHFHNENCYDVEGTLTCSIPEHAHVADCVLDDLDLTADVEAAAKWDEMIEGLELTGNWSEDLLTVAKSQLDYAESKKNCVLVGEQLNGYTRYGDWFGNPYWDWDDMFVSFCLHYAEIAEEAMPRESDTARWVEQLAGLNMFAEAQGYAPQTGDLVFLDTDEDEKADFVGIAAEQLNDTKLKIIAGDTDEGKVDYITCDLTEDTILGYGILPENPLSEEQWSQTEQLQQMLEELPSKEAVLDALQDLNEAGDKAGYEALRQEVSQRIESIIKVQEDLNEEQLDRVEGLEQVEDLQDVCGGENWQELPVLTDDSAILTGLTADEAEVISAADEENENKVEEATSENMVRNQDVIRFWFTAAAESYYSDLNYGEARVKVELVLPLTEDKARFDIDAIGWLEGSELTEQTRTIGEAEIACQVLTGYKHLSGTDTNAVALPGGFTEAVPVVIQNMLPGEQISLIISAAMEHGAWEGLCEEHQVEEKLTVQTDTYTLYESSLIDEENTAYQAFLSRIEEIKAAELTQEELKQQANKVKDEAVEAYYGETISAGELEAIGDELREMLGYYAEYATGISWMLPYSVETAPAGSYAVSKSVSIPQTSALSEQLYSTVFASDVQIESEGGDNVSAEGAVYVSKTIEGTESENVFDITLEIITQDQVNEVYKEPDMAVVVVMDISNTMNSSFGSTTRYEAAMDAGEEFLKNFAENTSGLSKVGYVAFNTHAHEIFDLSSCGTAAEAAALAAEMRNDTRPIIKANGYAESRDRFTNIEAGLKMANDMLADVTNQHKYIIFISDGFPTTYVKSGYTGYDPYTGSGRNGTDGVFYDAVLDVHCDYGTSYSDTAAIKARQLAVNLKNQGVNIFSIGVDVGGQNLWTYHNSGVNWGTYSVFERREEASYYNTNGYEIGTFHSEINKTSVSDAERAAMAQDFKDWLKGTATTGIGSGYYYDSTNTEGLKTAYEQIFAEIKAMNAQSSHLDWVATDPMPGMGVHELETIEFIGFWDVNGELQSSLSGESKDGAEYENTATFNTETQTISWDLKSSRYVTQAMDNTTNYYMWLTYRVRLKNEDADFVERAIYDTNDETSLAYRIIEVTDGVTSISDRREVEFPVPAVEGYLSELNFRKTGPTGVSLAGAGFTLSHDVEACEACTIQTDTDGSVTRYETTCAGEGVGTVAIDSVTATSDREGMVTFTNIPSGHIYKLEETTVPDGYIATENTYQVVIAYDAQTVTVLDADGDPLEWTGSIANDMYYELPNTGGMGTSHLTFGGALMILGAGLMYICITGRKRRKGGQQTAR